VKEALQFRAITQHKVRARSRERELSPRAQKEREQLRASLQEQGHLQRRVSESEQTTLQAYSERERSTASGGLEQNAIALVLGGGELIVIPNITFSSIVALQATGVLSGSGYIYGQEWSPVAEETNTWTPAAVESNTWTPVTAGTNTWAQNG
jgi:hypothetical protein